jgi:hypothetical protein
MPDESILGLTRQVKTAPLAGSCPVTVTCSAGASSLTGSRAISGAVTDFGLAMAETFDVPPRSVTVRPCAKVTVVSRAWLVEHAAIMPAARAVARVIASVRMLLL